MHKPVLLKEVVEFLNVKEGGVYLDGTLGLGGHTEAILKNKENTIVIGMDRDERALKMVKKRLAKWIDKRLFLFQGNFKDFQSNRGTFPFQEFDGILLDLGFSSFQVDDPKRGFSFQKEGPLDMRMDTSQKTTAADLVNTLSASELSKLFFTYGEERQAKKIAQIIVRRREQKKFRTTLDLSNLIASLYPIWMKSRIHPATRVFQALRIAVNDELEGLDVAFSDLVKSLKTGGRCAIISFHSLEDRLVKQSFQAFENPCVCPSDFPHCTCGKQPIGKRVTKKPIIASDGEILLNPRARSAKMRVIERI